MKVTLIRGVMIAGVHQDSGTSIEVDDNLARTLIASGKATLPTPKPKEKPKAKPKAKSTVDNDKNNGTE